MTKHKNLLSVSKNIQIFADNEGGEEKITYSKEEYESLLRERDNLKNRTDELSKSEKTLKEQLKSKLSEEEKNKQEKEELDKQLQEQLARLREDNLTYKTKGELANTGLEDEAIEKMTKLVVAGDVENLLKEFSTQFKALKENLTKTITAELQKQNKLPGGQGGGNKEVAPEVQAYIDSKKNQGKSARDYYIK